MGIGTNSGWRPATLTLTLPVFQLLQLRKLDLCRVQLRCQGEGASIALVLPALQELRLSQCDLPAGNIAAMQLPQLTNMSIKLLNTTSGPSRQDLFGAVAALLQWLPQLSSLVGHQDSIGDVAPLDTMQSLQSCSLQGIGASHVIW